MSDLGNGQYFLAYRLFHALLVLAFLLLFVRALQIHDRLALAVAPLALTVFLGMHTFLGTVKEIYPTNHFLQVAVLALVALNLTQSRGGMLVDLALLTTFTVAALTAALRDNGEVMRLIGLGADPNQAGTMRADFAHNEAQVLTPLEAAVGTRRTDMVELLLEHGAHMDAAMQTRLTCFARRVEADDVRALLEERRPPDASATCEGVQTPW